MGPRNRGRKNGFPKRRDQTGFFSAGFSSTRFYRLRPAAAIGFRVGAWGLEVGSAGFEPAKAEPLDLQSSPFDRSGNFPHVLVISVRTQISPNQNLPQERHRFFRFGAPVSSEHFPRRISHSEAGRTQNDHRADDQDNGQRPSHPLPDAINATSWKCFRTATATIGRALPPGMWSELAAGVEPATT